MKRLVLSLLFLSYSLFPLEEEELIWENRGPSVQEYHSAMQKEYALGNWWNVIDYANLILYNFPTTPFAQELSFVMGEAYFKLGELEFSNECFTTYLRQFSSPKHFQEAIEYKFQIADRFANGEKKRLFSSSKMPAWVSAKEDSIDIFDEVIAASPYSDLAAGAMLKKAKVQTVLEDYKPGIETLDLLIRRFPKSPFAAEGYLEKGRLYLLRLEEESLDPDILDLAELNLKKFRLAFPREPRLKEAEKLFREMLEVFAKSLFEIGAFFEKTKKIPASLVYYRKVLEKYPETKAAHLSKEKIAALTPLKS